MKKFAIILFLILVACRHEGISITEIEVFSARKTYVDLSNSQYDSIKALNPEMSDSSLERAGLIKDGRLLVEKFNAPDADFELHNNGEVIKATCTPPNESGKVILEKNGDSGEILMDAPYTGFCIADVIPGGYPEIVALHTYYIMNGDNFDVRIYVVK